LKVILFFKPRFYSFTLLTLLMAFRTILTRMKDLKLRYGYELDTAIDFTKMVIVPSTLLITGAAIIIGSSAQSRAKTMEFEQKVLNLEKSK